MSAEEFSKHIEALRAEYRAGLPDKFAELDGLWHGLSSGTMQPGRISDLRRGLHSLAGSARTFGVAGVGEAAAAAESWLDPFCNRGVVPGPDEQPEFQRLLDALKRAVP
jgi:chemotaxis protein histidine kinase CheA